MLWKRIFRRELGATNDLKFFSWCFSINNYINSKIEFTLHMDELCPLCFLHCEASYSPLNIYQVSFHKWLKKSLKQLDCLGDMVLEIFMPCLPTKIFTFGLPRGSFLIMRFRTGIKTERDYYPWIQVILFQILNLQPHLSLVDTVVQIKYNHLYVMHGQTDVPSIWRMRVSTFRKLFLLQDHL